MHMQAAQLSAVSSDEEQLMWQTLFTKLLLGPRDESVLGSTLKNLAQPHLQKFALSIASYLKDGFQTDHAPTKDKELLLKRTRLAQKLLQNMQRIS